MDTAKTAVLSECGRYRYELTRTWGLGRSVCWIMLNPSTADADVDDATIRKCIGFSQRWGYGGIVVVNLFALRSTDPKQLYMAVDPIGPRNPEFLRKVIPAAALVVAAWGNHGWFLQQSDLIRRDTDRTMYCLGTTAGGEPRHPGRVGYATPLVELRRPPR
jgi:hypothetical protein